MVAVAIGYFVMTTLHVVVGELIPKSFAIFATERYALFTAGPLMAFYKITYPVMILFNGITNAVVRLTGHDPANEREVYTGDEIKLLIDESTESGLIDPEQNEFVDNIFDLGDKDAEAIMTPRTNLVCIDLEDSLEENMALVTRYKYTRYPVCREIEGPHRGLRAREGPVPDAEGFHHRRSARAHHRGRAREHPRGEAAAGAAGGLHEDRRGGRRAWRHGRHRHHDRHHGADRGPRR